MPYSYENLKNHISDAHPEILDSFEEGWSRLRRLWQANWRRNGLVVPRKKVDYKCWLSWTATQIEAIFELRKGHDPFDTH